MKKCVCWVLDQSLMTQDERPAGAARETESKRENSNALTGGWDGLEVRDRCRSLIQQVKVISCEMDCNASNRSAMASLTFQVPTRETMPGIISGSQTSDYHYHAPSPKAGPLVATVCMCVGSLFLFKSPVSLIFKPSFSASTKGNNALRISRSHKIR